MTVVMQRKHSSLQWPDLDLHFL